MHECDGQTDRQTEFSSLDRVCIACSAVKTMYKNDVVDANGAREKHTSLIPELTRSDLE